VNSTDVYCAGDELPTPAWTATVFWSLSEPTTVTGPGRQVLRRAGDRNCLAASATYAYDPEAARKPRTVSIGDVYSCESGPGGGSGRTYACTALPPVSTWRGALLDGTVKQRADLGGCALISYRPGGS
jgi:hypothetical protein